MSSYHQYECGINKMLLESGLNIYTFLTVRAVCIEGLAGLLKIRPDLDARNEQYGQTERMEEDQQVYQSSDFRLVPSNKYSSSSLSTWKYSIFGDDQITKKITESPKSSSIELG